MFFFLDVQRRETRKGWREHPTCANTRTPLFLPPLLPMQRLVPPFPPSDASGSRDRSRKGPTSRRALPARRTQVKAVKMSPLPLSYYKGSKLCLEMLVSMVLNMGNGPPRLENVRNSRGGITSLTVGAGADGERGEKRRRREERGREKGGGRRRKKRKWKGGGREEKPAKMTG